MRAKRGVLFRLFFNRNDERAYGRFAFFFDTLMINFSNIFASGAFYTAFLRLNNISMADVGIMTYMPIIANLSCLFAPFIFRRMKKRKAVLMASRMTYFLLNLVGVALVPFVISDPDTRVFLMAFFLSFANVIWGLFVGGFTDWELNFLPLDGTREEFFAYRSLICAFVSSATTILSGFVATAIEQTAPSVQVTWLFWLRVGGFLFILLDVLVYLRVKEYPYPQSEVKMKIKDIFVLPMQHKPFRTVIFSRSVMSFAQAMTGSCWIYYLMDCGLNYSTLSFLSSVTPIMALVLTPFALRLFRKMGCVRNIFAYRTIEILIYFGYVFIIPENVRWLYPVMFLLMQVLSVGVGIADTNLCYLFMPERDRVTFHAFYYSVSTVASFLGSLIGATFITRSAGKSFEIFGIELANVQMLMLAQATIFTLSVIRRICSGVIRYFSSAA